MSKYSRNCRLRTSLADPGNAPCLVKARYSFIADHPVRPAVFEGRAHAVCQQNMINLPSTLFF